MLPKSSHLPLNSRNFLRCLFLSFFLARELENMQDQAWWCMPAIPTLEKWRGACGKFKAGLESSVWLKYQLTVSEDQSLLRTIWMNLFPYFSFCNFLAIFDIPLLVDNHLNFCLHLHMVISHYVCLCPNFSVYKDIILDINHPNDLIFLYVERPKFQVLSHAEVWSLELPHIPGRRAQFNP